MTLNEVLKGLGFRTQASKDGQYCNDVLDGSGKVIFTGRAWQVWEWLGEIIGIIKGKAFALTRYKKEG